MTLTRNAFLHVCFFIWIISNVQMCPDVPRLRTVLGSGWDALTNKDTKQVMQLTYDQCKLTTDGRFLIPDNTFAVSLNAQDIQVTSQIFDHGSNYTAPTAAGFKVGIDDWTKQYLPLYYVFSDEYQEIKTLQVSNETFTCRSQLRQVVYRIHSTLEATIVNTVKNRFVSVIKALVKSNVGEARYLIETIVRDYGTHVTKSVDLGAIVIKDDYLRESFLKTYGANRYRILSASKLSLVENIGFAWKHKQDADSSLLSEYNDAVLEKKMRFFGGLNWNEGEISEYMVAIDKSGDLLSSLLTSSNFPRASSSLLITARRMFSDVIRDYYERNIHRGCTRPKSNNFKFAANLDDGSCTSTTVANYFFGGVYVTCDQDTYTPGHEVCDSASLKNPLTGTTSCPLNFETSIVYSRTYYYVQSTYVFMYKEQRFISCMTNKSIGTSYLFGGLYSPDVDNIHTMGKSCPQSYTAVSAHAQLGSLSICVNNTSDDSAKRYALPFGGFASATNEYHCPIGYKKYLAMKFNASVPDDSVAGIKLSYYFGSDENIYYCLLEHERNIEEVASLVRPPFESVPEKPYRFFDSRLFARCPFDSRLFFRHFAGHFSDILFFIFSFK